MNGSIREAIDRYVAGDLSVDALLLSTDRDDLYEAALGAPLVVLPQTTAKVLLDLEQGSVSASEAQRWASFVRRGFFEGVSGPGRRITIDYDAAHEDVIVEAIARLDELGDFIDGTISREENRQLRAALEA